MTGLKVFDLKRYARNSLNYFTTLTDEKKDYLPYWLILQFFAIFSLDGKHFAVLLSAHLLR